MTPPGALAVTGGILLVLALVAAVSATDARPLWRSRLLTAVAVLFMAAALCGIAAAWWEVTR